MILSMKITPTDRRILHFSVLTRHRFLRRQAIRAFPDVPAIKLDRALRKLVAMNLLIKQDHGIYQVNDRNISCDEIDDKALSVTV